MEALIQVFKMSEISIETRIKILKQLGKAINDELASNLTQALVYELVLALDPSNEIKHDSHYSMYVDD